MKQGSRPPMSWPNPPRRAVDLRSLLSRVRVPHLLVALSVVPLLGGALRLASLSGAGASVPNDARFSAAPWPVVLHIVTASLFCLLGAFQFDARLRHLRPLWHRYAGRVGGLSGLVAAATGVWMTLQYDIPEPMQGTLLLVARVVVGVAMALALIHALRAIGRADLGTHRAWMVRAYALGQGAGTQVLLLLPAQLVTGAPVTGPLRDGLMTAAWAVNVLVAELAIRRFDRPVQQTRQGDQVVQPA